jgi:hypothetical protein
MKFLNKTLARQANKKIDARVAFEKTSIDYPASRADFLSQEALLSCSLRRSESDTFNTLEASDHTSIKERFTSSFDLKKATDESIKQQRLHRFDLSKSHSLRSKVM